MIEKIKRPVSILLTILMLCGLITVPLTASAATAEGSAVSEGESAYAVYDPDAKTLTFKYDGNMPATNAWDVSNTSTATVLEIPWHAKDITKVVFEPSFADARPKSTAFWFCEGGIGEETSPVDHSHMTELEGLSYLNTSDVTNMQYMFAYCTGLTSIDVSSFNTENVTNMRALFYDCSGLTTVPVGNWDTGNVTDIRHMFFSCTNLTNLDVSNWDTADITRMDAMFAGCNKLTTIDVSRWDTGSVTNLGFMFQNCFAVNPLDISGWDTSNVTYMSHVFQNCRALTTLDVSSWETGKVTVMERMFQGCYNVDSLDVSNFDTSKVTDMIRMFSDCYKLKTLDISNFDISSVTDLEGMFMDCSNLRIIYVADENVDWSTGGAANSENVFGGCPRLQGYNDGIMFDADKTTAGYAKVEGGYFTVSVRLISGHTLTLAGDIGINFYIDPVAAGLFPEDVAAEGKTLTVDFAWKDPDPLVDVSPYSTTVTVNSSNYTTTNPEADKRYVKVTARVCAAEMSSDINVNASLNGTTDSEVYSVQKYCATVLDASSKFSVKYKAKYGETKYNDLVDLVKKMLDYGTKAQVVFNILPNRPANSIVSGYTMADVNGSMIDAAVSAANPGVEITDLNDVAEALGMRYYTTSLFYLTKSTLRHYFAKNKVSDTVDESLFDGHQKHYYYYVEKEDIAAAKLDTVQVMTVGGQTIRYSALDYAKSIIEGGDPDSSKNVAKALYWYNQAANVFFGA